MRRLIPIPLAALLLAGAAMASATSHRIAAPQSTAPLQITVVETVTGHSTRGSTGPFTAWGLVCASGTFEDTETPVSISTVHTCLDGSGTFDSFHRTSTGVQSWTFTGGTGAYAALRGNGSCQVAGGPPIVRTCQFLAAYDDVAPSATIERFSVSPAAGRRTYTVRTTFMAQDDVAGNAVDFKLSVRAGSKTLARKTGTTSGAAESFRLKVKTPKAARKLTLALTLADPVGNTRTVHRTKRLPRRR
jgi:hypothetical protein